MTVKYIVKDNAAIITLSRPKYLNTLTFEMINKIETRDKRFLFSMLSFIVSQQLTI